MAIFCRHKWEVLTDTIAPSKFEGAVKAVTDAGVKQLNIPHQLCCMERKHTQILACAKCGKLKRYWEWI